MAAMFQVPEVKIGLITVLFPVLLAGGGITGYGGDFPTGEPLLSVRDDGQGRISANEAVTIVQESSGGKILAVSRVQSGYRIKLLTRQGRVRIIHVDAFTGTMSPGR